MHITKNLKTNKGIQKGFTLIELLVVISIIALLSSVVVAAIAKSRVKARDTARIQNARQLALALEQYEQSNSTYKISNAGLNNEGGGYVSKGSETDGYSTSIVSALKSQGYYTSDNLIDPVFGTDNYYVGLCTSTNAYNVFVKLEQTEFNAPTSTVANTCGGPDAISEGFTFIGSTTGGNAGVITPTVNTNGFAAAYEQGMGPDTVQGGGGAGGGGGGGGVAGDMDTTFNPGTSSNNTPNDFVTDGDGKIVIVGQFTTFAGTSKNRIVRLNTDGSLDTNFNPGTGANGSIFTVARQSDGKYIIGGDFTNYNGTARSRIARINSDGSLDTSFNVGTGINNYAIDSFIQSDGKIVVVGQFTSYNALTRNRIIRLNSDGTEDSTFNTGVGANGDIMSTLLQPNGKILIGGNFTSYNGNSINRLARLNADGSIDPTFNNGSGAGFYIYTMALQTDGRIVIGGLFSTYNGTPRQYIARVMPNGPLDTSFDVGSGFDNLAYGSLVQPDGKIIVSGFFTTYNGLNTPHLVRLNYDGSVDSAFNTGGSLTDNVYAITFLPDMNLLVGGIFSTYKDTAIKYYVKIFTAIAG